MNKENQAVLYGVGVGPGDPELLTLKAVRIIQGCDVIMAVETKDGKRVAWEIALQAVNGLAEKETCFVPVVMTKDTETVTKHRNNAAEQVTAYLGQGKSVAFLTLGDPAVYSTYLYIHEIVREQGYPTKLVPGIPSFCAAAAELQQGLCTGNQPLAVIPASYAGTGALLDMPGSKVLMKTGNTMGGLKNLLREKGMLERARMVENCGFPSQRVYEDMDTVDDDAHYFSVILIQ